MQLKESLTNQQIMKRQYKPSEKCCTVNTVVHIFVVFKQLFVWLLKTFMFPIIWGVVADSCSDSQYLSSCLLSSSARNTDMHFSLLPPFFSHCFPLFQPSSSSSTSSSFSCSYFVVDVSSHFQLADLPIDDKTLLTVLIIVTRHKQRVLTINMRSWYSYICSAHQFSLWSCDACSAARQTDGQTGRHAGDELTKNLREQEIKEQHKHPLCVR